MKRSLAPSELIVPILIVIFFALLAYNVHGMMNLATIFPYVLMIAMFIFGVGILVLEAKGGPARANAGGTGGESGWLANYKNPAIVFIGALVYVGLIYLVGYFVATFVYTLAFTTLFGNKALKSIAIATGFTASLYVVFVKLFAVGI